MSVPGPTTSVAGLAGRPGRPSATARRWLGGSVFVVVLAHLLLFGIAAKVTPSAQRTTRVARVFRLVSVAVSTGGAMPSPRAEAAGQAGRVAGPTPTAPGDGRAVAVASAAASVASASMPGQYRVPEARRDAPATAGLAPDAVFHASSELDVQPRPRSAPDTHLLEGLPWSGVPLRLRLFVDARGVVVDVKVLQSLDSPEVNGLVRQMFLDTGFVPGRIGAEDVASFKDIEVSVRPLR